MQGITSIQCRQVRTWRRLSNSSWMMSRGRRWRNISRSVKKGGVLPGKDLDWSTTLQPVQTAVKGGGFKVRHKPRLFSVKRRPYSDTLRHAASRCRTKEASGSMFRNISPGGLKPCCSGRKHNMLALNPSRPVKFKREAPPQMSSAPAERARCRCRRG